MTLTAIQSENGRIFGGFTTKKLQFSSGYTEDDKAWIFSIDQGTKHKVK